jgi:hypothetical protein
MQSNSQKNYYMINMQKTLFVAGELHKRGYENLHVVPSVAPTGLAWRCNFVTITNGEKQSIIVSNWIYQLIEDENKEIKQSHQELAELFEKENVEFLAKCKSENREYVEWYNEMLNKLQKGELPYAFAEYFSPTDFWKTSLDNEIKILPNEKQFYLNY